MKKIRARLLVTFIIAAMIFSIPANAFGASYDPDQDYLSLGQGEENLQFWENEKPGVRFYINAAGRYILETVEEPRFNTTKGEWSVMDLLRGMYTGADYINYIPKGYFDGYLARVESHVSQNKGELHFAKSTEWSRSILSLSALGYDIKKVGVAGDQYDYIEKLSSSHQFSFRQGINGPIWELIAMDTGKYEFYDEATLTKKGVTVNKNDKVGTYAGTTDIQTRGKCIDYILSKEISSGGWAQFGDTADPDITGMALQALAPYYKDPALYEKVKNAYVDAEGNTKSTSYADFAKAVERGVLAMAGQQSSTGGFSSWGSSSSESIAQIIVGLTALNMDPDAASIALPNLGKTTTFKKANGKTLIDALLSFWAPGSGSSPEVSGFKHVVSGSDGGSGSGTSVNAMATDQALYALIAYDRFKNGKNALYDMTDMTGGQYKTMKASTYTLTLDGNSNAATEKKTYSPYAKITLPQKESTNKDSAFISWNTKQDGSGTEYEAGSLLCMPEKDVILYAQYADPEEAYERAAQKVIEKVNAIGAVTVGSKAKISIAEAAYNKLTPEQRTHYETKHADNWEILKSAQAEYAKLVAEGKVEELNKAAAASVDQEIAAIGTVTLEKEDAVISAREAYEALTEEQRAYVTKLDTLAAAEQRLKKLQDEDAQRRLNEVEAGIVSERIKELGDMEDLTLASKDMIEMTRLQYDALTKEQQALVKNYQHLVNAENQYKKVYWINEELGCDYALTAKAGGSDRVQLNWKPIKNAQGYRIYRWFEDTKEFEAIGSIQGNSNVSYMDADEELTLGGTYRYRIKAYNVIAGDRVEGRGSEESSVTLGLPAPSAASAEVSSQAGSKPAPAPKKGTTVTDKKSNGSYVVTKTKQSGGTVTYKKPVNKKKTSVTIPAAVKIQGKTYQVTAVEKNAFKGNKQVKSVKIGANVQTIGAGAFSSCTKLKTVTIPSQVKTIQKNAFANCRNLKTITIQTKKLTKKTVKAGAFKGVNSKAVVKVPKGKAKAYKALLRSKGLSKTAAVK